MMATVNSRNNNPNGVYILAILAPYARWSVRNLVGDAAINGRVFTYKNGTDEPKLTFQDPANTIPNSFPIELDGKGEANVYWETKNELYTIRVYDSSGVLILTQNNYPITGSGEEPPTIIINETASNLVRNSQFYSWHQLPNNLVNTENVIFDRLGVNEPICDDWLFERSNTNATITISREPLNQDIGDPLIFGNPRFSLRYQCTDVGVPDWGANIYQTYESARTCSGQEISFGMRVINVGSVSVNFQAVFVQYFGTGGSTSATVYTPIVTQNVAANSEWTSVTGTVSIPSVNGKSFGTNGDDFAALQLILPPNTLTDIGFTNIQLHVGSTLPPFPYSTNSDQLRGINDIVISSLFNVGDIKYSLRTSLPQWLLLTYQATIGNSFSGATHTGNQFLNLFVFIWNNINNTYCPILNSNGTTGSRGASAIDDWRANKRIFLPNVSGRVMGTAGNVSGIGNYALGEYLGNTTTDVTDSNMHIHHHNISQIEFGTVPEEKGGAYELVGPPDFKPMTINTDDSGQGNPIDIMQPTIFFNSFIKL